MPGENQEPLHSEPVVSWCKNCELYSGSRGLTPSLSEKMASVESMKEGKDSEGASLIPNTTSARPRNSGGQKSAGASAGVCVRACE